MSTPRRVNDGDGGKVVQGMKAGRRPKRKEKSRIQYVVVASFSMAVTNVTRRPLILEEMTTLVGLMEGAMRHDV
jgi:hypothetical protein